MRRLGAAHAFLLAVPLLAACQATAPPAAVQQASLGPCQLGRAGDLPLKSVNKHLLTTIVIKNRPFSMIVDTGANTTLLSLAAANRLHTPLRKSRFIVTGVGGGQRASVLFTRSAQIGSLHGAKCPLLVTTMGPPWTAAGVDGLFGTDSYRARTSTWIWSTAK